MVSDRMIHPHQKMFLAANEHKFSRMEMAPEMTGNSALE
jgi:hypothetical protein